MGHSVSNQSNFRLQTSLAKIFDFDNLFLAKEIHKLRRNQKN